MSNQDITCDYIIDTSSTTKIGDELKTVNDILCGTSTPSSMTIKARAISVNKMLPTHVRLMSEDIESVVASFTSPYKKPVLRNHDKSSDPLGRVISASYNTSNPSDPFVEVGVIINNKEAIERFKDGRYVTLSVGMHPGRINCSVCGKNPVAGECDHMRGQKYDVEHGDETKKVLCTYDLYNVEFNEISVVNVPADSTAQVIANNTISHEITCSFDDQESFEFNAPKEEISNDSGVSEEDKKIADEESEDASKDEENDVNLRALYDELLAEQDKNEEKIKLLTEQLAELKDVENKLKDAQESLQKAITDRDKYVASIAKLKRTAGVSLKAAVACSMLDTYDNAEEANKMYKEITNGLEGDTITELCVKMDSLISKVIENSARSVKQPKDGIDNPVGVIDNRQTVEMSQQDIETAILRLRYNITEQE